MDGLSPQQTIEMTYEDLSMDEVYDQDDEGRLVDFDEYEENLQEELDKYLATQDYHNSDPEIRAVLARWDVEVPDELDETELEDLY